MYKKYIDLDYMVRIRRQLHMYPELSFDLPRTLSLIRSELDNLGVEYTENYGKSSIVAFINSDNHKFTIGIRADTDALPIMESNNVEYRSKIDGVMHACGHDVHTAALLGTVKALNLVKDKINCRVAFLFQAAEEGPGGARLMVEDGVLDEIDIMIGCHVDNAIDVGSILARDGITLASSDNFMIDLYGQAGHAAAPQAAHDTLAMGTALYNDLMLLSREIAPSIPNVLTVCIMNAGKMSNTIPDYCHIEGTLRTHSDDVAEYMRQRISELAERAAMRFGGHSKTTLKIGYGALVSDPRIAKKVRVAATNAGVKNVIPTTAPTMYAEDFSHYAKIRPASYFFLGTRNKEKGITAMTHNNNFDVDERALECAARVFSSFVCENMNGIEGNGENE